MLICASTACFPELSFPEAIDRLVDLEFSNVEIALNERLGQLKPSQVAADLEKAIHACRDTHRLGVAAAARARAHFGMEALVPRLEASYAQAISRASARAAS